MDPTDSDSSMAVDDPWYEEAMRQARVPLLAQMAATIAAGLVQDGKWSTETIDERAVSLARRILEKVEGR